MREKKLENKIKKKVYSIETKKVIAELVIRIIIIGTLVLLSVYFIGLLISEYARGSTLDVLQIFQEDAEIIRDYWKDAWETIYYETPWEYVASFIAMAILVIYSISLFVMNFNNIKGRIRALVRYWRQKR